MTIWKTLRLLPAFRIGYREWKKTRRLSMRQEHRAGEKLFIDFCGPTIPVINLDTGEVRRVTIFVAVIYLQCAGRRVWSCNG
ncbi:hypothetical protein B4903_04075 [Yersinia frederiksenii]|nr:hypothetical protein B4903_04075 [Yersinia frederiksenii]